MIDPDAKRRIEIDRLKKLREHCGTISATSIAKAD